MGIFLNPGKGRFQMTLNGQIYVDKSEMISYLNTMVETPQRYLCVSRPRRFGKTTALDMLCAYYGIGADSREMFATQKLGQRPNWDRYLGKFHVLRLTMTQFFTRGLSFQEGIQRMRKLLARDFTKCFPDVDFLDAGDLILSMQDVYQTTQAKFVVVIDEWDSLFREYRDNRQAQHDYLDFLRDWLKDQDCIALAYMTGILPVKKYGKQSALNMFTEYSMLAPLGLAPYTGFTAEDVEELCRRFGRPFEAIREWYDGYQVSDEVPPDPDNLGLQSKLYHLYAPLSVVSAVRTGVIQNYWNKTESYEALAEYIRMDFDGLKETVAELMGGRRIPVSLRTYQNDMTSFTSKDDVLALLIHLGYLGYEQATGCAFIPNREILDEYYASTQGREWGATMRALKNSQELLEATWAGNGKRVAELIEAAHDKAGNRTYNSEAALSYAVQLAYYKAQDEYTVIPELDTGKGYADLVYLPKNAGRPAILVELKHSQDAETAIDQILRKDYPSRLEHYQGNLILIGISYDRSADPKAPNFKHHSCRLLRA